MASQGKSTTTAQGTGANLKSTLGSIIRAREFGIFAFLILTSLLIGALRPTFVSGDNLLNMGRQMATTTIMAVAMTFLITSAEMDLSVGSVFGFCTLGMALLTKDFGINLWVALAISLMAAAVIGFINGFIVTRGGIPAFIVTLGTLYIIRGLTLLMSPWPVSGLENPTFYKVLAGDVWGIPVQIFWMLGIVLVGQLVLTRGMFGYNVARDRQQSLGSGALRGAGTADQGHGVHADRDRRGVCRRIEFRPPHLRLPDGGRRSGIASDRGRRHRRHGVVRRRRHGCGNAAGRRAADSRAQRVGTNGR